MEVEVEGKARSGWLLVADLPEHCKAAELLEAISGI